MRGCEHILDRPVGVKIVSGGFWWYKCRCECVCRCVKEEMVAHTPQKKCRMKTTSTRRGPFSLSAYSDLNVYDFLFASNTCTSATFSSCSLVGALLFTLISPLKSAEGSIALPFGTAPFPFVVGPFAMVAVSLPLTIRM